jgi:hypothetical protein
MSGYRETFILIVVASLFLLTACNKDNADSIVGKERSVAVVKQMYVHFNNHDWDAMAAMYIDSAEFKDPSLGAGIVRQSRKQIMEKYAKYQEMSPDIRDDIVQIYPSGESHVVVEFISSGTAPGGERWSLPICTIFTVKNDLIVKDFTYYDNQ